MTRQHVCAIGLSLLASALLVAAPVAAQSIGEPGHAGSKPNPLNNVYFGEQDLPKKPGSAKAPTFAVWALKDPESGNLDRVQIVKGWQAAGHGHEQIYDVAWSDNRKPDAKTGKLPPVGNTVDIKNASYDNSIGDTQLSAVWTDPDFDPSQHAVYYVRVLEIPTPRWSTYDAKTLGIEPVAGYPATQQERAWSSPIWYTPDPSQVAKDAGHISVHGAAMPEQEKK